MASVARCWACDSIGIAPYHEALAITAQAEFHNIVRNNRLLKMQLACALNGEPSIPDTVDVKEYEDEVVERLGKLNKEIADLTEVVRLIADSRKSMALAASAAA